MLLAILASHSHGGNSALGNCEAGIVSLLLPGVKNIISQSTKIAGDDGTISVIVTKRVLIKEGHCHPRQQDSRPFPKNIPDTPCIPFLCVLMAWAAHCIHCAASQKYQRFHVNHVQSFGWPLTITAPSGCSLIAPQIDANVI